MADGLRYLDSTEDQKFLSSDDVIPITEGMGARNLKKYINRSPRYELRPQDKATMRICLETLSGQSVIHNTLLVNLSETGAAFLVDPGQEPKLDQKIKVEIPIPGGEQIAWFGQVVRIQVYEPSRWRFSKDPFSEQRKIVVAVQFEHLPGGHSKALRKGLEKSFLQIQRDQQYRTWLYYRTLFARHFVQALVYAASVAFFVWFMWYFTRPDSNYDSKRGAPWGDRFKSFKIGN